MRDAQARGAAWLIEAHKVGSTMLEGKPSPRCADCRGTGLFFGVSPACRRSMAARGLHVEFPRSFDGAVVREQNLKFNHFNDAGAVRVTTCKCTGRVNRFDVPHSQKVEQVAYGRFGAFRG